VAIDARDVGLEMRQEILLRSLEWITFDRLTYPEALVQSNALVRYFLGES
jgi:nuclear pore complex protein Nup107